VGRVGDDAFGASLRAALEADGIDVRHVGSDPGPSGIALIMVDDDAQNRIAIVAGANASLVPGDVNAAQAAIAQARLLVLQLEAPLGVVVHAAQLGHRLGCAVVLNPAPVQPLPDTLWPLLSMLVANESEAALLAGTTVVRLGDAERAATVLRRRGPACVIVTLGARGAVIADDRGCRHVPAIAVKAVDTTAAGDTFVGALCAALTAEASIDAAVSRAVRAAAVCVTRPGAQPSIPRADELAELPVPPEVPPT
jgi:ribokinase